MRLFIGILVLFIFVLAVLSTRKIQKEFVAPCTVRVVGKAGGPIADIRVSEDWDAYSYDLSGGLDIETGANGQAFFPSQSSTHSILFWALRPTLTRLNYGAHSSSGTTARIGVSEPSLRADEAVTKSFSCSNAACVGHPLELEIKVASR